LENQSESELDEVEPVPEFEEDPELEVPEVEEVLFAAVESI